MARVPQQNRVHVTLATVFVCLALCAGLISVAHRTHVHCTSVPVSSLPDNDDRKLLSALVATGADSGTSCILYKANEWDGWHAGVFRLELATPSTGIEISGWRKVEHDCPAAVETVATAFPELTQVVHTSYTYGGSDRGCNVAKGTKALVITASHIYLVFVSAYDTALLQGRREVRAGS